jgi:ATP-binding cassette subfamily B (MDR/TAP) protein 1
LVEEALGTIGIATAFNARPKLTQKYDTYLAEAQQIGFKKGPVIGVQWSVEFFSTFCAYSLAWFYGVKLLNQGKIDSGGDIIALVARISLASYLS